MERPQGSSDAKLVAGRDPDASRFQILEFLVNRLGVGDVGATFSAQVTLSRKLSCLAEPASWRHSQRLLKQVPGIDLVDLSGFEQCCGFGGTLLRQERRRLLRHAFDKGALRAEHQRGGLHCRRQFIT